MNEIKKSDLVISYSFGLGQVVGKETINDKDEYFVVQSVEKNIRTYVPVKGKSNFRKLSTEHEIHNIMDKIGSNCQIQSFKTKKDRILYFKKKVKNPDINVILKMLNELNIINDRGALEEKIYCNLINTISLELSVVKNMNYSEARKKVISLLDL